MFKNLHFISLGCSKNLVDSELMLGETKKSGYSLTSQPSEADTIVINTCSFIEGSKRESIDAILEMAQVKKDSGKDPVLVVTGCLAQRYAKELSQEIPEIDVLVGTGEFQKLNQFLEKEQKNRERRRLTPSRTYVSQPAYVYTEGQNRLLTGLHHSTYLKISEGCNRLCSFCIIPTLRGRVRSRTIPSLVKEAENLALQGVKELNLVAQDLTHYGIENRYRERLETLLPELCQIKGIEWIRLHYVYPDQFTQELIRLIKTESKIVKYLDMPVQHTQNSVLKRMNRGLRRERLFELMAELRTEVPELVFRTSVIVGFPGETEEDFQGLKSDISELDFDHLGVFAYSKEEGTPAYGLSDQVPEEIKKERKNEIEKIWQKASVKKRHLKLNRVFHAMIEGKAMESEHLIEARLPGQAKEIDGKVLLNDLGDLETVRPGEIVPIEVTEVIGLDFMGRVLSQKNQKGTLEKIH